MIAWLKYKDTPAIVNMPTGSGKSHVIAALAEHYYNECKNVLILAHRKELIEQTGGKISGMPVGYYSASLGKKELHQGVTLANIQSMARVTDLPPYDVVLIDECHMVPPKDGIYWNLLNRIGKPKIAGFSATPYRLKGGKLGWGDTVYEIGYKPLFDAGYLCPVSNKLLLDVTPNLASVPVALGEYKQEEIAAIMEDPALLTASIAAIRAFSVGRNSCLIFTVSVNHAYLVRNTLAANGIEADIITGETPQTERDDIIERFRAGSIRFLINCEVLLVGFDAPCVDAIFCLRPTKSKGLWEQMCGRGVREYKGKVNCLLIDMAGNLSEHGGLGTPHNEKNKATESQYKGKICPECEEYVQPMAARVCNDCGYNFPEPETPKVKHNYKPDMTSSAVYEEEAPQWYEVSHVSYKQKKSKKGDEMIVIEYHCDYGKYGTVCDWILPYHEKDFPRAKAESIFKAAGNELGSPIETYSLDDLMWHAGQLKCPKRVNVVMKENFPTIIGRQYEKNQSNLSAEELLQDEIKW